MTKLATKYGQLNIVPKVVITINEQPFIPQSFELVMNSYLESDTLTFNMPVETINVGKLIKDLRIDNKVAKVELWCGYAPANSHNSYNQSKFNLISNDKLKINLLENYRDYLTLMWCGHLSLPTVTFDDEDYDHADFVANEMHTLLQSFYFEKNYEGDDTRIGNILSDIQKQLNGSFEILISDDLGVLKDDKGSLIEGNNIANISMGTKRKFKKDTGETETVEQNYSTVGKTYWDVIVDLCNVGKLSFLQSDNKPFTYIISKKLASDKIWTLDRYGDFNSCKIRMSDVGGNIKQNVAIIVKSEQTNSTDKQVEIGTFPRDLDNHSPESHTMKIFTYNIPKDLTQAQCEDLAREIAISYSRYGMTGTLKVPNAIIGLRPDHLLQIADNSPISENRKVSRLTGDINNSNPKEHNAINFRINSVTMSFDVDNGLSMPQVEFELDYSANSIDLATGEIKGYQLIPDTSAKGIVTFVDPNKLPPRLRILADLISKSNKS